MTTARPHRILGWLLIVAGVVGVVTGVLPLAINGMRVVLGRDLLNAGDTASHGVEAMGLSVEWAMLSSAMGTFLGILLLWAGYGCLRQHESARLVTWIYVLGGLMVNVPDMLIFVFGATPGPMRTRMLILDGIATVFPVVVATWLLCLRRQAATGR